MQASDLGIRLALVMLVFTYGGYRLDAWLSTSPLLLILGVFVGLGGGMWSAVRSVDRITARSRKDRGPPRRPDGSGDGPA